MAPVKPVRIAGAVADVTVPSRRTAGVSMAGFRSRADAPVELQVVPYPALTVFIDFGDALITDDATGARKRGSIVAGFAPGRIRGAGRNVDLLQIRLSPVLAHAMLGAPSELSAAVVTLEELWGREAARVEERIRAARTWDDRFAIARAALARRYATGRTPDPEVAFAWHRMMAAQGTVRVERLADEVGWSRKRLWSRFRDQVGLSPKRAANLVRFDHVTHRLAAGHSIAAVAADAGFADQSHLHRDVISFSGMTPAAVATAPWLAVDDVAWPDQAQPRDPHQTGRRPG